jgi:hypothetical protein
MNLLRVLDLFVVTRAWCLQEQVVVSADGRLGQATDLGTGDALLIDLVLFVVDVDEELLAFVVMVTMFLMVLMVPLILSVPMLLLFLYVRHVDGSFS